MAQLVIWIAPKELSGDPALDNARWAPGHVVDVLPDDQPISETTAKETRWRVLQLPGVDPAKVRALAAAGDGFAATASKPRDPLAFRRATKLDMTALAALEAHPTKSQELRTDPAKAELLVKALAVSALMDAAPGKGR